VPDDRFDLRDPTCQPELKRTVNSRPGIRYPHRITRPGDERFPRRNSARVVTGPGGRMLATGLPSVNDPAGMVGT
jgi:hypothetical protein